MQLKCILKNYEQEVATFYFTHFKVVYWRQINRYM